MVSVADRTGSKAREIRSGPRLGVSLAPPGVVADDAGQIASLLLVVAEGVDDRSDHRDAEGEDRRCASSAQLLAEHRELLWAPAEAAVLLRPAAGQPAASPQSLQPGAVLVAPDVLPEEPLAPRVRGQLALAERANLGPKVFQRGIRIGHSNEHSARRLGLGKRRHVNATHRLEQMSRSATASDGIEVVSRRIVGKRRRRLAVGSGVYLRRGKRRYGSPKKKERSVRLPHRYLGMTDNELCSPVSCITFLPGYASTTQYMRFSGQCGVWVKFTACEVKPRA